ncbi:MAG: NAD(P)H-dependent oxidoreductase subunit E [Actinomycetota bacterium]
MIEGLNVLKDARTEIDSILAKYPNSRSATIPLLFLAQSVEGYVSEAGMRDVAAILRLTPAEVLAVASFYTMLKKSPQGTYLISVCRNITCSHMGGRKVLKALEDRLGIEAGGTTADEMFSLEAAECLATCDGAPSLQVNYEDFYKVSSEEAVDIVDLLQKGETVRSVAGAPVRTSKEIARETALTGTRLPHERMEVDSEVPAGGETGSAQVATGHRPPVRGGAGERDVEATPPSGEGA